MGRWRAQARIIAVMCCASATPTPHDTGAEKQAILSIWSVRTRLSNSAAEARDAVRAPPVVRQARTYRLAGTL